MVEIVGKNASISMKFSRILASCKNTQTPTTRPNQVLSELLPLKGSDVKPNYQFEKRRKELEKKKKKEEKLLKKAPPADQPAEPENAPPTEAK